jgi:O-antigen biosynthesis protein WbqP
MIKRWLKRGTDIVISLALLPVALPLCALLLVLIRLDSKGNPLFIQWRVGHRQAPFRLFKLRSMRIATGDHPSHEVNPVELTRIGGWIRRTKLDELPQLLNVINGTMSLVGPRPCLVSHHQLIAQRASLGLFAFRPGITGPAQLAGLDMSEPKRLAEAEAAYYPKANIITDLTILIRTALGRGSGDAVLSAVHSVKE